MKICDGSCFSNFKVTHASCMTEDNLSILHMLHASEKTVRKDSFLIFLFIFLLNSYCIKI